MVGNHLAQHRELSLLAIGLAVHIQSVPDGTRVDIKSLSARFPEGEARIAAALRELEAHGYLARTVSRTPAGRVVTRTVSYAHPAAAAPCAPPDRPTPAAPRDAKKPAPSPAPSTPSPEAASPAPEPPLPAPRTADPTRDATATALLASLHRDDDRLLLSERDTVRLSPAVAAWLERGVRPETVRRTLMAHLPPGAGLRHPAALLAHRLTALLPPPLPVSLPPGPRPAPFQECPDCGRPFRAPHPGHCRDCRTGRGEGVRPTRGGGPRGSAPAQEAFHAGSRTAYSRPERSPNSCIDPLAYSTL
ncbi:MULTISPECIES: hypothetical protein [Streptomyces]|uniref:hypothetical protein n=1 Tax=Streptomyces TaxID=1883 RepID=UPI002D21CD6C|nr:MULTISPECIES: hypothetical protein [Streptomyces]